MKHKKDFDKWNGVKKYTQYNRKPKYFRQGEIWWCRLGVNVGHEEDGKGEELQRPVLVIKKFNNRLCFAVPLSTINKTNPFYKECCARQSKVVRFAIISQLKALDSSRFIKRIGSIEEHYMSEINKSLRRFF